MRKRIRLEWRPLGSKSSDGSSAEGSAGRYRIELDKTHDRYTLSVDGVVRVRMIYYLDMAKMMAENHETSRSFTDPDWPLFIDAV